MSDEAQKTYRSRADWFGQSRKAGVCQCCQKAAPVHEGYTGGQPLGVTVCSDCRYDGHTHP